MKKLTLVLSDLMVLYGTLVLVLVIRYGVQGWHQQYAIHALPFTLLFVAWFLAFYIANLYEPRALRNGREFLERLAQAIGIASALSIIFFYLIPVFGITPKTNLFLFILVFAVLETGMRYLFNGIIAGGSKKRLLIVGITDESLHLAGIVTDNPQFGYSVRALVRLGQESIPGATPPPWHIIDDMTGIDQFIRAEHIDTVVIGPQAYRMDSVVGIFYRALAERVDFVDLTTFTEKLTGKVPVGAISQSWFLSNITEGSKRSYEVVKRSMDVTAAVLLGLPTLILLPLVALAIKLDSRGPILFRQKRTGRGGQSFEILKFRSMRTDAEKNTGAVWAQANDPRVTRVGRFLRETRIDELPQLWNVITGQMSLTGPRAERPEFDEKLAAQIPFYRERYLIKPGLSGWAQINYPYGSSTQDAIEKLQYDLYYVKHRSVVLDLEIILKTINISLRRAGR